jgi:arginyl-tRNA synthetase
MSEVPANVCSACGVEFSEHSGVVGTCYKLQYAIGRLKSILEKGSNISDHVPSNALQKLIQDLSDE